MREQLKGISLVLFGILLCCAEEGINSIVLSSYGDFPFSLLGLLVGCAGLLFVFRSRTVSDCSSEKGIDKS